MELHSETLIKVSFHPSCPFHVAYIAMPPNPVLPPAQDLRHPDTLLPEKVARAERKDKESNTFKKFQNGFFKLMAKFLLCQSQALWTTEPLGCLGPHKRSVWKGSKQPVAWVPDARSMGCVGGQGGDRRGWRMSPTVHNNDAL